MKRLLIISLVVVAAPVIAIADGGTMPELINPPTSGLTVRNVYKGPDTEVTFTGKIWVSGTFRAEWHPNFANRKPAFLVALAIKPDDAEYVRLPHYGSDNTDFIWIDNQHGILQSVFGTKMATQFLNRQMQVLEVHGRFLIEDYSAGECGSPWARANLISVEVSNTPTLGTGLKIGDC